MKASDLPAQAMVVEGFDDALVGTDWNGRAVYDGNRMATILAERDGMSFSEAVERLAFNTWCANVGDMTPIYLFQHPFGEGRTVQ